MKNKALLIILISINLASLFYPLIGQAQEVPKNWEERFTYEGGGKRRPGPHGVDPNIWVYTQEFANQFGMPDEWINPDLKGAVALAWRKVPDAYSSCGWGGQKDACRQEFKCEMDIYIDESKNPLPWARDAKLLDVTRYFASTEFLSEQSGARRTPLSDAALFRGLYGGQPRSPFVDPDTGEEIFLRSNYSRGGDAPLGGSLSLAAWERGLYGKFSVLVRDGAFCFGGTLLKDIRYRIGDEDDEKGNKKPRSWIEIVIPKNFMERVDKKKKLFESKEREFYQRALGFNKGE